MCLQVHNEEVMNMLNIYVSYLLMRCLIMSLQVHNEEVSDGLLGLRHRPGLAEGGHPDPGGGDPHPPDRRLSAGVRG